jgi:hypothetical protein
MSYAQIELQFTRFADPGTEYLLKTVVNQVYTTPDEARSCLVVKKGGVANEELMSVATYDELVTTPFEQLPVDVNIFTSPSLASISVQVDDILKVTAPLIWSVFGRTEAVFEATVESVISPTEVEIVGSFPSYAMNLSYEVWRVTQMILPTGIPLTTPNDGTADRDYTGLTGTFFLADAHADVFAALPTAENRMASLKSQAESLMNALNNSQWTGFEEVRYP